MSENQTEGTTPTGDTGTQPVSETAEQGTPAADQTSVTDETQGDGGTADSAEGDGGTGDEDGEKSSSHTTTSVQDGSLPVGEDVKEKPVWNTATHGPLADDDPRRENYEVI